MILHKQNQQSDMPEGDCCSQQEKDIRRYSPVYRPRKERHKQAKIFGDRVPTSDGQNPPVVLTSQWSFCLLLELSPQQRTLQFQAVEPCPFIETQMHHPNV